MSAALKKEIARVLSAPHAYAVLGLYRKSTEVDAQLARRELARDLHPDRCRVAGAESAMAAVNVAADALADSTRYWTQLKARKGAKVCAACEGSGVRKESLGKFKGFVELPCTVCGGAGLVFKKEPA
jgi:DnaJ-class molecular chaperone